MYMPGMCPQCRLLLSDCVCKLPGIQWIEQHRDESTTDPKHYRDLVPEPIDAIEGWALGYRLGNVIKYIARAAHKGQRLKDLMKARWYLDREIARTQKGVGK